MPSLRRYRLRKDQLRQLLQQAGERFGAEVIGALSGGVEVTELESGLDIISVGNRDLFFRANGELVPTLSSVDAFKPPRVVVDMGAVPHVVNGADIMGPGIVSADLGIKEGDVVLIVDERHGKAIAIGVALLPGAEMKAPKGKVVKNLHHVGDKIWRFLEKG